MNAAGKFDIVNALSVPDVFSNSSTAKVVWLVNSKVYASAPDKLSAYTGELMSASVVPHWEVWTWDSRMGVLIKHSSK